MTGGLLAMRGGKGPWLTRVLLVALTAVSCVGCERWPWESDNTHPVKSSSKSHTSATATPAIPDYRRVATVNGSSISTTDVEIAVQEIKRLMQVYGQQEWTPLSDKDIPDKLDLHDVVDNLVISELKAQDAVARGLERKPEVARHLAYLRRNYLAQEWDRMQGKMASPTEKQIHQFYEDYKLGFMDPERIHLRQIVVNTVQQAESVRARAVAGEDFGQLAAEVSIGPAKEKKGDVGWFLRQADRDRLAATGNSPTESVLFPQLEPVAFALEEHQVSQPVKGPDGHYYCVQLLERRPARQRSELEVHDSIKAALMVQAVQRQVESLRNKAKVKYFPERLKLIDQ